MIRRGWAIAAIVIFGFAALGSFTQYESEIAYQASHAPSQLSDVIRQLAFLSFLLSIGGVCAMVSLLARPKDAPETPRTERRRSWPRWLVWRWLTVAALVAAMAAGVIVMVSPYHASQTVISFDTSRSALFPDRTVTTTGYPCRVPLVRVNSGGRTEGDAVCWASAVRRTAIGVALVVIGAAGVCMAFLLLHDPTAM